MATPPACMGVLAVSMNRKDASRAVMRLGMQTSLGSTDECPPLPTDQYLPCHELNRQLTHSATDP